MIRVRFAPSPTGFLHIGGVRAALFNWLFARHSGGQYLVRIEDTDLERSEPRFTQDILSTLKWLGLQSDETPIYQSARMQVYRERAEALIAKGHAYKCWCTEAEVEQMRVKAEAAKQKPMYDRRCRESVEPAGSRSVEPAGSRSANAPYVIRAKIPLDGAVEFQDLIRGTVTVQNSELDDFVLIRSNGAPTYNLSVVIDDAHSRITHVIRGDDHINNTPKQLHLYRFFEEKIPVFAHLPMILGPDKKKLSKRHGAVSTNEYRAEGYLPEALMNFLARIGWSHGDQEVFSVEEMVKYFGFDHVQNSSGVFNTEKLLWVNGEHLKRAECTRVAAILLEDFAGVFSEVALSRLSTPLGLKLVAMIQPKVKVLKELAEQLAPLLVSGGVEVPEALVSELKWSKNPALKEPMQAAVREILEELTALRARAGGAAPDRRGIAWGASPALEDASVGHTEIDALLRRVSETHAVKLGDLMQPLRLCMTGRLVSGAGLFDLLYLMPWDVLEPRLKKVLEL